MQEVREFIKTLTSARPRLIHVHSNNGRIPEQFPYGRRRFEQVTQAASALSRLTASAHNTVCEKMGLRSFTTVRRLTYFTCPCSRGQYHRESRSGTQERRHFNIPAVAVFPMEERDVGRSPGFSARPSMNRTGLRQPRL